MKVRSAAGLRREVEALIGWCRENDEPPTDFVVLERLGLTPEALAALLRGDGGEGMQAAAVRLAAFREHYWVLKGLREPKLATFSTYHLKELRGESQEEGLRLTVVTEGVGESAFA